MSNFDLIRSELCNIINTSYTLNNKLNSNQINYLIKETKNLSDISLIKLLFLLDEKTNYRTQRLLNTALKAGIVTAIIVAPGSIEMSLLIKKLIDSYNWKCEYKCRADKRVKKNLRLCYKKCDVISLKKVENKIKSEIPKCKYTENPLKCKNKLFKELIKIKQKQVDAEIKLKQYLRAK